MTVKKEGFRTVTRSGLELDEGQVLKLDFRLELGQVTAAIEVKGQTSLLDTSTTAMSMVVPNQKIEDLPISGRNPVALAQLVSGVRMIGSMGTLPISSYAAGTASIGGGSPGSSFASHAAHALYRDALGLWCVDTMHKRTEVRITDVALAWCEGRVAVPEGAQSLCWEVVQGGAALPAGCVGELRAGHREP